MAHNITKRQFENRIQKIMIHNEFEPTWTTVEECEKHNKWTPVDLVLREYYNNGGGSAKGFLGITPTQCIECYEYIKANASQLIQENRISETGYNNFGFRLWSNYNIH